MSIYAFRAEVYVPTLPDLTGFTVEATDGNIGKIDEATMASGATCLVVDTGFWIFGKKRMIPAAVVMQVDPDNKDVFLAMTKDEVKNAPDFDEARTAADIRAEQDAYYRPYGG